MANVAVQYKGTQPAYVGESGPYLHGYVLLIASFDEAVAFCRENKDWESVPVQTFVNAPKELPGFKYARERMEELKVKNRCYPFLGESQLNDLIRTSWEEGFESGSN